MVQKKRFLGKNFKVKGRARKKKKKSNLKRRGN
ncbi:MAG: hypothetical protein CM15mV137_140 [uncultured marine virus]|nr:MAG: hypothetical protein CM15mV137_140 [uncultured marine virus]